MTDKSCQSETCNQDNLNIPNNVHQEFLSRSLEYKATSKKLTHNQFEIFIYQWSDTETDDNGCPVWEKSAGPYILETQKEAEKHAIQNLQILSGEVPDKNIKDELINEVITTINHDDFYFFKPEQFQVNYLENPETEKIIILKPAKVLFVDNFYFTEHQNHWKAGFLEQTGQIKSFRKYTTLKEALNEILTNDEDEI